MKLRFTAPGIHTRNISRADFMNGGVEDQGSISIDVMSDPVVDVSEAAGKFLLEREPNDWQDVTGDAPEPPTPEERMLAAEAKAKAKAAAEATQ